MRTSNRVTAELLISIPQTYPLSRVWRSNTGGGVGMGQVRAAIAALRLGDIPAATESLQRPMKFGVPGGGDIQGIFGMLTCLNCAAPMVPKGSVILGCLKCGSMRARKFGVFLSGEVKDQDKQSVEQVNFERMVEMAGGLAFVAHSCAEGMAAIAAWVERLEKA